MSTPEADLTGITKSTIVCIALLGFAAGMLATAVTLMLVLS